MIDKPAFKALSSDARTGYLLFKRRYNGRNNGTIGVSARDMGNWLGKSKSTGARVIRELEAFGFIVCSRKSAFSLKAKLAAEYRLTEHRCDLTNHLPTRDFEHWIAADKKQNTVSPSTRTVLSAAPSVIKLQKEGDRIVEKHGHGVTEYTATSVNGATPGTHIDITIGHRAEAVSEAEPPHRAASEPPANMEDVHRAQNKPIQASPALLASGIIRRALAERSQ
jgi:hypothetical protein